VLRRNRVTLDYLLKLGWQVDEAAETQIKSTADGTPLAVCLLAYTRDAYQAFRQGRLGKRILQKLADAERARVRGASAGRRS
jgi:hypothetical protein